MDWGDDRGETLEDKLNAILFQIEEDLERGRYGACYQIPNETDLIGKPALQMWAERLRAKCAQLGIYV